MNEEPIEFTLRSYPRFPRNWYYPKFRLATWHPTGVLDDALADKIVEFVEWEEYVQDAPFDRYTDFSYLTEIRLKMDHVFEIARRRQITREPVKSAFFADKPIGLGVAQMFERLMGAAVMITVRVFEQREAAAQWLGVPVKILHPPDKEKRKPVA